MKKLLFVAIAFAGLALVSCNKDQAAVKKLDGTWNVTSSTTTSGSVTVDNMQYVDKITMTFTACKLKKDEWCTSTSTVSAGSLSFTENDVFKVTNDGTKMELKCDTCSTSTIMTIDELTKTNLKTTWVDGSSTTVTEATKQ